MTHYLHPSADLALRAIKTAPPGNVRALLLEGPPGCGKTSFAEHLARELGAQLVYQLLHSWSDDQELFRGVNVVAAVAGDADSVAQPGVLALAASASHAGIVVVCLDELDKAPDRVEALLLDVLQSGRVPIAPGVHEQLCLDGRRQRSVGRRQTNGSANQTLTCKGSAAPNQSLPR